MQFGHFCPRKNVRGWEGVKKFQKIEMSADINFEGSLSKEKVSGFKGVLNDHVTSIILTLILLLTVTLP